MTGFAKALCVLAFVAVAMMQPAGHWYCTVMKTLCPIEAAECCSHSAVASCDSHSEESQEDPCCVEMAGEWQLVPASAFVSLPDPILFELFAWASFEEVQLPLQATASGWDYGGNDPPPQQAAAHALFCVRLI